MRFDQPLIKLPIRFCADTLAAEMRALPREAWVPHPQRFAGNEYVPLVTPSGLITNEFAGPMQPTIYLEQCPYMMEAMTALDAVCGRSRLMGLGSGADVPVHVDLNYYWRTHVRVHIPIITNPDVSFSCGDQTVRMAAGECWVLDTFRPHHVENEGPNQRVHLVLDTVGGERLWDLIEAASGANGTDEPEVLEPGALAGRRLKVEQHNHPRVMSPWEMRCHFEELLGLAADDAALEGVRKRLDRLIAGWSAAWMQYGDSDAGHPEYLALLASAEQDLIRIGCQQINLSNDRLLYHVLRVFVFENAVESSRVKQSKAAATKTEALLAS